MALAIIERPPHGPSRQLHHLRYVITVINMGDDMGVGTGDTVAIHGQEAPRDRPAIEMRRYITIDAARNTGKATKFPRMDAASIT